MTEIWNWITGNLPPWFIVIILALVGVVRYGPRFMKEIVEIGDRYKGESDTIKNEYLAHLKRENEKLNRVNTEQQTEINYLRKQIEIYKR